MSPSPWAKQGSCTKSSTCRVSWCHSLGTQNTPVSPDRATSRDEPSRARRAGTDGGRDPLTATTTAGVTSRATNEAAKGTRAQPGSAAGRARWRSAPGAGPGDPPAPRPRSLLVVELLEAVPHGGLARPRALALLQEARHVLHGGGGARTEPEPGPGRGRTGPERGGRAVPAVRTHFRPRGARWVP